MKTLNDFLDEEKKVAKTTAKYQVEPKGKEKCSSCTMWRSPHGCSSVKGYISPDGWCSYYERKKQ